MSRAWLFGGSPVPLSANSSPSLANDIWRFFVAQSSTNDQIQPQWTQLSSSGNMTIRRPSRGAGCNVPDLQRGYYLGGMSETSPEQMEYLHWLHIFDFPTETLSSIAVPDFVPVVNQSLVFLNTGTRSGALVALGGYIESGGTLSLVRLL